jgi:hypothetical protein
MRRRLAAVELPVGRDRLEAIPLHRTEAEP